MVFKKDKKIEERIEKLNLLIRNEKLKIFDNQKSKIVYKLLQQEKSLNH